MSTLNKCKHVGPRLLALSAGGDRGAVLVGMLHGLYTVSYTHLTLPTKRIV